MSPNIHLLNGFIPKEHTACFDFDWTLVRPKSDGTYTLDQKDWKWLFPNIPVVIQEIHNSGFSIVVFTNQNVLKQWKELQILEAFQELNLPCAICIGFQKEDKKPNISMLQSLEKLFQWTLSPDKAFFIGDALGREGDFGDFDLQFGKSIGVQVLPPEDFFLDEKYKMFIMK